MEVRYLAHAKQMRRWSCIPQHAAEFQRSSAATPAGWCAPTAPRTPRPSWSRSARCSARSRTRWTRCAREGHRIGVLGISSFRPFPLAAVRRTLPARAARRGAGEEPRGRHRRHRRHQRAHGALRRCTCTATRVIAGLGGRADHPRLAAPAARARPTQDKLEPLTLPGPRLAHRATAELRARSAGRSGARGPIAENPAARRRRRSRRRVCWRRQGLSDVTAARQVLPDRHLHGRQPAARAGAAQRAGSMRAHQFAQLGPPRVPGLRRGARRALRDRRGDDAPPATS